MISAFLRNIYLFRYFNNSSQYILYDNENFSSYHDINILLHKKRLYIQESFINFLSRISSHCPAVPHFIFYSFYHHYWAPVMFL